MAGECHELPASGAEKSIMPREKADIDERVMELVESELEKNPAVSVGELQRKATEILPDIESLSTRQFHARYPLQIKRRKNRALERIEGLAAGRGTRRGKASRGKPNREAIRATFLRFASDLTAAEARKDLVRVLAGVDRYVDQVIRFAGR